MRRSSERWALLLQSQKFIHVKGGGVATKVDALQNHRPSLAVLFRVHCCSSGKGALLNSAPLVIMKNDRTYNRRWLLGRSFGLKLLLILLGGRQ